LNGIPDATPTEIFARIYNGSMPQLMSGETGDDDAEIDQVTAKK